MSQLDADPPVYPYLCIYPPRQADLDDAQDVGPTLSHNISSELGTKYPSFNLCRLSFLGAERALTTSQTPPAIQIILCVFIRQPCPDQLAAHPFLLLVDQR